MSSDEDETDDESEGGAPQSQRPADSSLSTTQHARLRRDLAPIWKTCGVLLRLKVTWPACSRCRNAPGPYSAKIEGMSPHPKKRRFPNSICSNCLQQTDVSETTLMEPVVEQHGTDRSRSDSPKHDFIRRRSQRSFEAFSRRRRRWARRALLESGPSPLRSLSAFDQRKALDRRSIGAKERSRLLMSQGNNDEDRGARYGT